jgi:hypothetical protein
MCEALAISPSAIAQALSRPAVNSMVPCHFGGGIDVQVKWAGTARVLA